MKLVVGLGNPGPKFEKTRHNIGFRIIEEFAKKNNFPGFKLSKKLKAEVSKGVCENEKIILVKPQGFMNESGKSVKLLIAELPHHQRKANTMGVILRQLRNFWVVHDDIDLPLGKIRISIGRGAAGHKGVESIIKELKTKNFVRFRIGIHPIGTNYAMAQKLPKKKIRNVEHFVLQKFNKDEEKIVKEVIEKTNEAIEMTLKEGIEKTMDKFNR